MVTVLYLHGTRSRVARWVEATLTEATNRRHRLFAVFILAPTITHLNLQLLASVASAYTFFIILLNTLPSLS